MSNLKDFKNKNTEFTGEVGIDLPEGATSTRVNEQGRLRFNTETGLAEYYNGTIWKSIDAPPAVSSASPTSFASDGSTLFTIQVTGQGFDSGGTTAKFVGDDGTEYPSASVTFVSATRVDVQTVATMTAANGPYDIQVTNTGSGLSGTGYAETISYYDNVKVQQDVKMREPLEFLTDLIFNQDDAEPKPEGLVMTFNPLFQLDRETEEKSRFFQAQIDEKYINAGVVSKEEITQSRFGTGRYNYDTILDETLGDRISVTEQAAEQQSEQAKEVVDAAKEDRVGENDKVPSPSEK